MRAARGQWQCWRCCPSALLQLPCSAGAAAGAVTALIRLFPLSLPLLCSAGALQAGAEEFPLSCSSLPVVPNSRAGGSEDVDKYFWGAEFTLLVISTAFQGQNMDLELNPWLLLCCKLSLKPLWAPRPFWSLKVKQSFSPLHVNTGGLENQSPSCEYILALRCLPALNLLVWHDSKPSQLISCAPDWSWSGKIKTITTLPTHECAVNKRDSEF